MSIWTWFGKLFHTVQVKIAPAIVVVLNAVDGLETTGILPAAAAAFSKVTGGLSTVVNAAIIARLPITISAFLGLETLSSTATAAQITAWEQSVITAVKSKKATQTISGQVLTTLSGQIFADVQAILAANKVAGKNFTLAEGIAEVENAYQELQADLAATSTTATT
jgi:hypothetical protein